jgi:ubiquinone/menaquinone biosynthesis C-methylase UbiE
MKGNRVRRKYNLFSRLPFIVLLAGLWRVFSRRTQERIPSVEGLEDPEVAIAFEWVGRTPQMGWLRHYVISQASELMQQGEAVDLGCGAGQLVMEMALKSPGLHITGIDLSEELLTEARISSQRLGLKDRVEFRLGDVEEIPFPDQSLDLVISTLSLHHWAEPIKVLNEIDRVLKPGGAYYIFDLRRDLAFPFYLLLWFATQFIVPAALHRVNEPMGSRNASYTFRELHDITQRTNLRGGQITTGPIWIVLAGNKSIKSTA